MKSSTSATVVFLIIALSISCVATQGLVLGSATNKGSVQTAGVRPAMKPLDKFRTSYDQGDAEAAAEAIELAIDSGVKSSDLAEAFAEVIPRNPDLFASFAIEVIVRLRCCPFRIDITIVFSAAVGQVFGEYGGAIGETAVAALAPAFAQGYWSGQNAVDALEKGYTAANAFGKGSDFVNAVVKTDCTSFRKVLTDTRPFLQANSGLANAISTPKTGC